MSAFDNAKKFFDACEAPLGWEGCKEYCVDGAGFVAQSEPLADVTTIEAYADWMHGFGTVTAKELHHLIAQDIAIRQAQFTAGQDDAVR